MREQADILDTFENSLISSVATKTGKEIKEIKDLYFDYQDHWLTADEAKDASLIDTIVDQEADLPDDAMNMKMKDIMDHYSNMFCSAEQNKKPIKNFFSNLINQNTAMKIDAQILNALSLDADAKMEEVVKSIQDMAQELIDAKASLTAEQDAHKVVKDQVTQLTADLETSQKSVTDITTERDTLQTQIENATTILDTLDASIKDSEDFAKKLEALTSFTAEEETKAFLAKDKNQGRREEPASWDKMAADYLAEN
jgi:chromosome segregation ATPase